MGCSGTKYKTVCSPVRPQDTHVHICWANGNEECLRLKTGDTVEDLRKRLALLHLTRPSRLQLVDDAGVLVTDTSLDNLPGKRIHVALTAVDVYLCRASISRPLRGQQLPLGFDIGTRVKSMINFFTDDGQSVASGDLGVIVGPGIPGEDDLTIDFPNVQNVGMRRDQVHIA
eukprot:TRINITY_DN11368_c0_g1_i1.p1 TRINITY_DN11368_c0_g1~~TRINITY_DN11368_c0_g1_i1.p1  ORF type:complete len:172 (-),score=20.68 TRINITY_DN11368_c0_g1_i1:245-760(-)